MIVALTARRLKPGSEEDFRAAFRRGVEEAPEAVRQRLRRVHVCRDVADENVILSFGLLEGSLEELRELQAEAGSDEERLASFEPYVDEILLDGSYEVLDEITP